MKELFPYVFLGGIVLIAGFALAPEVGIAVDTGLAVMFAGVLGLLSAIFAVDVSEKKIVVLSAIALAIAPQIILFQFPYVGGFFAALFGYVSVLAATMASVLAIIWIIQAVTGKAKW